MTVALKTENLEAGAGQRGSGPEQESRNEKTENHKSAMFKVKCVVLGDF